MSARVTCPSWCDPIACTFDKPSGGWHARTVGELPRDPAGTTGAAGLVAIGDSQISGIPAEDHPLTWIELRPVVFNMLGATDPDPLQPGEPWSITATQARQLALLLLDAIDLVTPTEAAAR